MARSVTFIHAADLHIGAPFRGLRALSPEWAERLVKAIPQSLGHLVEQACLRHVDFVVLAGDIFDDARASYADYRRFFKEMEKLGDAGIPVYLCTGNHDPYASWQQDFFALPPNVYIFAADRPDFALYERDGEATCILGGRGYPNSVWASEDSIASGLTRAAAEAQLGKRAQDAPFAVGVLHTGLHLDPTKAPADPAMLYASGFDYWALGHIHRRYVDSEEDPHISFSGCIQGRDIKETGRRGANVVTLEEGARNRVEFLPTASIAWQQLQVDLTECTTIPDAVGKTTRMQFAANGEAQCEAMVSRITLAGATPLHKVLARPGVLEDMRAQLNEAYADFFVDALIDATTQPIDRAALAEEGLFPSVLMRTAAMQRSRADEQVGYLQEEFLKRGLPLPAPGHMDADSLSSEAEELVLDLLAREEKR